MIWILDNTRTPEKIAVRAATEKEARYTASLETSSEAWKNGALVVCKPIAHNGSAKVVLVGFTV